MSTILEYPYGDGTVLVDASGTAVPNKSEDGGGGGSSDFSIASVTTIGGDGVKYSPMPILIYNDELMVRPLQPTSNIVLYKGTQKFVFTKYVHPITSAEGTGGVSVEYDAEYQAYLVTVTGDGTLTITTEIA